VIGQFLYFNFVSVVPKNFHINLYQTTNQTGCSAGVAEATEQKSLGFPFNTTHNTNPVCDDTNQWLLSGFLNAAYILISCLFLLLVRSNLLE
jgi:hypothetical protein